MKTLKRLLSILLTVLMFASTVPVSAETVVGGERRMHTLEDALAYWEEALGYEIPTKTYYFYFPDSWKFEANDYYDASVGLESCAPAVYWYGDCTAKPDEYTPYTEAGTEGYPGYALTDEVAPNIYKAEIPADVEYIVWTNGVYNDHAGQRVMEGYEFLAMAESYGVSDYENMICLPYDRSLNSWQYSTYSYDWFYYYGNGEYGSAPTKELAGSFVYSDGQIPDYNLLSAQSEVTTMVGDETVIDVNLTDTTATVEDESVATIAQQKDTGDWIVTGLSAGETNVVISKGEQSVTVKVKVEIVFPKVKINKAIAKNPKVVKLKWSVTGEADGYEIQMKKPGKKFKTVKTIKKGNKHSVKIKGLKAATKYKFRIKGFVQGGEKYYGKYSNKKVVVTPPAKAKIKSATAKSAHTVMMK